MSAAQPSERSLPKAALHPNSCPLVQWRRAVTTALGLIAKEMEEWPAEERPAYVHLLEPKWLSLRVHYSTKTGVLAQRTVHAYVPIVWHELAEVEGRRSGFYQHLRLVQTLNGPFEADEN